MKSPLLTLAAMTMATAAMADTEQTITINGEPHQGFATTLTFDGDNVTLHLADGASLTADMATVRIDLTYNAGDAPNAISETMADKPQPAAIYTLGGQYAGQTTQSLPKGIYIVGGKKMVIK